MPKEIIEIITESDRERLRKEMKRYGIEGGAFKRIMRNSGVRVTLERLNWLQRNFPILFH